MKKHGIVLGGKKRGGSPTEQTVPKAPLAGVLVGVSVAAIGLVCLYIVMRSVGLENDGTCVSGGPYLIEPGHECESGIFTLGYVGALGLIVGVLLFLWSSHRYGKQMVVTAASGISWSGFFGGLGGSFLSIGMEMPAASDTGSEFKTVGIIFLVMAAAGVALVVGTIVFSLRSQPLDYPKPSPRAWLAWLAAVAVAIGVMIVAWELSLANWIGSYLG